MNPQFVTDYLDEKMKDNEDYIICTFFDLRITHNVSENDVQRFLELAKIKLENMNYSVFFTGAEYTYKYERKKVKDNEYMVAIKNSEGIVLS